MRALPLLALFAVLSGCAAPATEVEPEPLPPGSGSAPRFEGAVIVDHQVNLVGWEYDIQCRMGGGPTLPRVDGALIEPGASKLVFVVTAGPGYTGLQVGYAIDGGERQWLESVPPATTREFEVPVDPASVETNATRWEFAYQLNLPEAEQDCYTGVGTGERAIKVEAVP